MEGQKSDEAILSCIILSWMLCSHKPDRGGGLFVPRRDEGKSLLKAFKLGKDFL
jgi:hypothetical protein